MRSTFALLFLAACSSPTVMPEAGPSDDATIPSDAPMTSDAATDTSTSDSGNTFPSFGDTTAWESFDITAVGGNGHHGGAFDGRYVYFGPSGKPNNKISGVLLRFDTTTTGFTQANAWQKWDLATIDPGLAGFAGATFDGTHLYLVPELGTPRLYARYKTSDPFGNASAIEKFDFAALNLSSGSFAPGPFAGKRVYMGPCAGPLVRFDTSGDFADAGGYETRFVSGVCASVAAWDGKDALILVPRHGPNNITFPSGFVWKLDLSKPLTDPVVQFDAQQKIDMAARQFGGGVFDGRYVYFAPLDGGGMPGDGTGALTIRYDTQAPFDQATSWTAFDLGMVGANAHGYVGGTFDGRYVYFVPNKTSLAIRYDTTKPFGSATSWETHDAGTSGFWGAVFDGAYVYFVPNANGIAVRFHARTQPVLPAVPSSFL